MVKVVQAEADVEAVKQRVAELEQKPLNAADARAKKVIDDIDAARAKAKAKVVAARAKQREVVGPKVERFEQILQLTVTLLLDTGRYKPILLGLLMLG